MLIIISRVITGVRATGRMKRLCGKDPAEPDDQAAAEAELISRRIAVDTYSAAIIAEEEACAGCVDRGQQLGFQLNTHPGRNVDIRAELEPHGKIRLLGIA